MNCACLLLHGFGGTSFEMEPLVPALRELGCAVELPLLPGHGTSIVDFRTTRFPDWLAYADQQILALRQNHGKVIVVGFSMGGSIALLLAARHALAGAVSLSAPLYTHRWFPWQAYDWRLPFIPLLKYVMPEISINRSREASRTIAPSQGYDGAMCLPQLHSLMQGLKKLRGRLSEITCPLLIMHDLHDRVSPPESALMIAQGVTSADITLRYTHIMERITSKHMITTHQETREAVIHAVVKFVRRVSTGGCLS